MTPAEMHGRIAEVVESLYDIENTSEVVLCLIKALEMVVVVSAKDKDDALYTVDEIMKDMRRDINRDYDSVRAAWAEKFPVH